MVTRNIFADPQAYATKLESDDRATKKFKTQPNVKGLKAFLGEQCLPEQQEPSTSSSSTMSRKRLLQELEQLDKPAKKSKKSKRSRVKAIAEELEDDS